MHLNPCVTHPPQPPTPSPEGEGVQGMRQLGELAINKMLKILQTGLLIMFSLAVYAQDSTSTGEKHVTLNGYIKDMQTVIILNNDKNWMTDNLIHNRLNFKWNISKSFTFCLEERNRFYWGELVKSLPGYKDYISYDNGFVNMSWNWLEDTAYVLNTAIDRMWLDFTRPKFQITVGRQRINWSQTYVWNPNDIFNTYSYFDFDYEEKPGSDAVRFQYFTGPASRFEVAVKADKQNQVTAAALYRFNKWDWDFQALGGLFEQTDIAIGIGWAGQIAKGGFKGEATYFHPVRRFSDSTGVFLGSLEYDYTFRNSIFIQFEGLYNSNTFNNAYVQLLQANSQVLNPKNPFLNGFSIFGNISYPFTPLINASLAGILNPNNGLYIIIPTVTVSLTNNLDLSLIAQTFQSYTGNSAFNGETLVFLRIKGSF
jgi:hypothetical protein